MRIAIVGLSLLIFGCGGGGGDGNSQQPTTETPGVEQPATPNVWSPGTESRLANVSQAKSALITAYESINSSIQLTQPVFATLRGMNGDNDVPATTTVTACTNGGTVTVTMSQTSITSAAGFQFVDCREPDVIMNGSLGGTSNVSGTNEYQTNFSFISPVNDGKVYANSRLIKHENRDFHISGVTDMLSFDMTVAGISTADGINTGGTVIVKTTSPLQYFGDLTTSPVGGEIIITNTKGKTWLAKVEPNGFDIYDFANSIDVPVDFLSWYSLFQ